MAIGNGVLMRECFPKHSHMGTTLPSNTVKQPIGFNLTFNYFKICLNKET